jgi:hypothetical protein
MANAAGGVGGPTGSPVGASEEIRRRDLKAGQGVAGREASSGKFALALGHGASDTDRLEWMQIGHVHLGWLALFDHHLRRA